MPCPFLPPFLFSFINMYLLGCSGSSLLRVDFLWLRGAGFSLRRLLLLQSTSSKMLFSECPSPSTQDAHSNYVSCPLPLERTVWAVMAGELGEKLMFVTYSFRQVFNEFLLSRCQWQVCFCCWWGAEMCKAQTLPWRSSTIVSGTHEVINMKSVW